MQLDFARPTDRDAVTTACIALVVSIGEMKGDATKAGEMVRAAWPTLTKHERHVVERNVAGDVAHWREAAERRGEAYDAYGWEVLLNWIWQRQ